MKDKAYWKAYRFKNRERLNASRMLRYHKGKGNPVTKPIPTTASKPTCQLCSRTDVKTLWLAGQALRRCPEHVAG